MGKLLAVSKNQGVIFITLLVLIFLGASYFFIYVPTNEKTVQERRFRCLQNIENNIDLKIQSSENLLGNLLKTYAYKKQGDLERFNDTIKHYPRADFTVLPMAIVTKVKDGGNLQTSPDANIVSVEINPGASSPQFTLYVSKKTGETPAGTSWQQIGIKFRFDQFVKPLPADVFDNYMVFALGEKVFETVPSDLNKINTDSLLHSKNGLDAPPVHDINVGGTDCKIFSQVVYIGPNNKWVLAGLVSASNYQKEKDQLPLWSVLLLLTTVVLLIVMLPWIKLHHMGNKDKLTVRDGIASILVSMLVMSLLFFIIFKYTYSFYNTVSKIFPDPKDSLATRITNAFQKELDTSYKRLTTFDSLYSVVRTDVVNLGKDYPTYKNQDNNDIYDKLLQKTARGGGINQVFWLDANGNELNNWSVDSVNTPHSGFGSRQYFKKIIEKRAFKSNQREFYLDQVVSRITDVFTSIITKRSDCPNVAVAGFSFTVQSLNNVVMPDGYQFAVINETGEVLYHSNPDRNLNENLKKELADSSELVSFMEARASCTFNAIYYGRQYNLKIKPIANLPYFIVIFESQDYNNARDTQAYVFTIFMLVSLLVFLVIQIGVVFFVSSRRSFFKKQLFDTSWVGPKTNSHRQYNLAILVNVAIIVLLMLFFSLSSFLTYVYILLFSITFVSIFLNYVFFKSYVRHKIRKYHFKRNTILALMVFIVLIEFTAFATLDPKGIVTLVGFELALSVVSGFIYSYGQVAMLKLAKRGRAKKGRRLAEMLKQPETVKHKFKWGIPFQYDHIRSFALMATTRLVITNGIPVAFFFIYSFNFEQNLDTRYKQLTIAKAITQKLNPDSLTTGKLDSIKKGKLFTAGIYYDDVFVTDVEPAKLKAYTNTREESVTTKLLDNERCFKNYVELKSDNLNFPSASNEAYFNKLTNEYESPVTYYKFNGADFIKVTSKKVNYPPINLFMVLLIIAFVALFYTVFLRVIRKLFALDLPTKKGWGDVDDKLLYSQDLNGLLLIVGPPGSGKLKKLKKDILDGKLEGANQTKLIYNEDEPLKGNVFIADMILISAEKADEDFDWKRHKLDAFNENNALVIINHFEYNIKDVRANNIKLDFLENLLQKGKAKLIIISTVHPLTFLDSFNESQSTNMPESELERWQVLLGHFRIIIAPLTEENVPRVTSGLLQEQIIAQETKYSHYLNNMQEMVLEAARMQKPLKTAHLEKIVDHDLRKTLSHKQMQEILLNQAIENRNYEAGAITDSLIFKLQITSHYYYTYIWQSLTKEEKFLLYDLAEDGLVNSYDDYNLSMLICKGLIVNRYGTLTLFNKGFRNFILTAIGYAEFKRIKEQVKDNGNWGSLKTPLNLAILAILAFLIVSQQEAYTRLITYVTALGAGVPAILKLFSMIPNNTQKTP